jgi:hypothetical protein
MRNVVWRVLKDKAVSPLYLRLLIGTFGFRNIDNRDQKNYFLNLFNHNQNTHTKYYQVFRDTTASEVQSIHRALE